MGVIVVSKVRGTMKMSPKKLEVNVDTVYIRSNIKRVDTEDFKGWEYDEIQYNLREYIENIGNENTELNKNILLLDTVNQSLQFENSVLQECVMELTTLASSQEDTNRVNEQAIMELSRYVMTGGS